MFYYEAQDVFAAFSLTDINLKAWVGLMLTSICFYIYYFEAVRLSLRHKISAMPVFTNMFNFANDLLFVSLFYKWFFVPETAHPITQILWLGMVVWLGLKCVIHYAFIKYDLAGMFPGVDRRVQLLYYAAMQLGHIALYLYLWSGFKDPLFFIMFGLTNAGCQVFNIQMIMKLKSRRGQSIIQGWSLVGASIGWFFILMPAIAPTLDHWVSYLFGTALATISLVYTALLYRFPEYVEHRQA